MRLPTFYEQNLIPNWGSFALKTAGPALLNIFLLNALALFTVPSNNPLLKAVRQVCSTALRSFLIYFAKPLISFNGQASASFSHSSIVCAFSSPCIIFRKSMHIFMTWFTSGCVSCIFCSFLKPVFPCTM
mgnify:FL=1